MHRFNLRTDNLALSSPGTKELTLQRGVVGALEWSGRVQTLGSPWVVVTVADEDPVTAKELMGAAWE